MLSSVVVAVVAMAQTFGAGSLIIPMDRSYQDAGALRAYGLVFALLREGVPVSWVIDPAKTWHVAPCDTPGDECAWDCAIEGSGEKCPYPTASPDMVVESEVGVHGYRGGPFVIDAADRDAALDVIDAWNQGGAGVVTVHEAAASFTAEVFRKMWHAPKIAVLGDGGEAVALGYLEAAGIAAPDVLSPEEVMGELGSCAAPNGDHENGALFEAGMAGYDVVVTSGWTVAERDTVVCGGGVLAYHGHELVAELRAFGNYATAIVVGGEAAIALENTEPVAEPPYFDDFGRIGHFLSNAGIAAAPAPGAPTVRHPGSPYAQVDGAIDLALGGAEVAAFAPVDRYAGKRDVVDIGDGGAGAGVWVNGRMNGTCGLDEPPFDCKGRISYLGGGSASPTGARLFFDALLASDATELRGRPDLYAEAGDVAFEPDPQRRMPLDVSLGNFGYTPAFDVVVRLSMEAPAVIVGVTDGTIVDGVATWSIDVIGTSLQGDGDPELSTSRRVQIRVPEPGVYRATAQFSYRGIDGPYTAEVPIVFEVIGAIDEPVDAGCCAAGAANGGDAQPALVLVLAVVVVVVVSAAIRKRRHRVRRA